jgi:hypothetical protein
MKPVAISDARRLANATGATRLLVVSIDDAGNYAFTTFGRTKAQCRALAEWADENAMHVSLKNGSGDG